MNLDFDVLIKDTEGNIKPSEPVSELFAQVLESFNNYESGDKSAMWSLIGDIRRKGEVELNKNEVEMLKKYWKQVNTRLDLDMAVRGILNMED